MLGARLAHRLTRTGLTHRVLSARLTEMPRTRLTRRVLATAPRLTRVLGTRRTRCVACARLRCVTCAWFARSLPGTRLGRVYASRAGISGCGASLVVVGFAICHGFGPNIFGQRTSPLPLLLLLKLAATRAV
jgi:hypothetical protein